MISLYVLESRSLLETRYFVGPGTTGVRFSAYTRFRQDYVRRFFLLAYYFPLLGFKGLVKTGCRSDNQF